VHAPVALPGYTLAFCDRLPRYLVAAAESRTAAAKRACFGIIATSRIVMSGNARLSRRGCRLNRGLQRSIDRKHNGDDDEQECNHYICDPHSQDNHACCFAIYWDSSCLCSGYNRVPRQHARGKRVTAIYPCHKAMQTKYRRFLLTRGARCAARPSKRHQSWIGNRAGTFDCRLCKRSIPGARP
jgi:hypothetical protein